MNAENISGESVTNALIDNVLNTRYEDIDKEAIDKWISEAQKKPRRVKKSKAKAVPKAKKKKSPKKKK